MAPEALAQLRAIGRFILYMQKADGSYYSKLVPLFGGRQDNWTSLYYPGEAALGLVMLYELDGDTKWLEGAAKTLRYLAGKRRGQDTVEADHWALLATGRLLPHLDKTSGIISADELKAHAEQVCASILGPAEPGGRRARLVRDGFNAGCRTCPTSTRLEGLLAAYGFLDQPESFSRAELREAIDAGIEFLLDAQIKVGEQRGGMTRSARRFAPSDPRYDRGDDQRSLEIRVDYVQHALSAMIAYHALLQRERER